MARAGREVQPGIFIGERDLSLKLHPARSLLAEGELDELERLLREVLPRWSRKLRVGHDETDRSAIDASRPGSLPGAIRRHMNSGATIEEAEFCQHIRGASGFATLTGEYSGVLVFLSLDDRVFSPESGGTGQHFGNSISIDITRDTVEEMPAAVWISRACATFCRKTDLLHGLACCDLEHDAKNMDRKVKFTAIGLDVSRYLPGLYWLNVFGKPYVKLIGKDRLLKTPGAMTSSCGTHVVVQCGDDPLVWETREYKMATSRSLGHLGRQYFFDRQAPKRKTVAPPFRFEVDTAAEEREDKAVWAGIAKILKRDGLSYDEVMYEGGVLTPRAIEALMRFCEDTGPGRWWRIYELFHGRSVPKTHKVSTAQWLIKLFELERDANDQIGVGLWDWAVPEIADDLIRLIQDRRYGHRRWPLCLALAKTKDPRAADVIASLLGQGLNTRGALEALGKVPAAGHVDTIRKYLRDPDSDVRREAKRTLKKLGFPVETAPPPIHLVKNRRSIPKGLEEWSTNLDMEDLEPTLQKLARCIDGGFGKQDIAEVAGVVDEMKPDQTRAFRFPVTAGGHETELWVVAFMDDIDSPDVAVYSRPDVIEKFEKRTHAR